MTCTASRWEDGKGSLAPVGLHGVRGHPTIAHVRRAWRSRQIIRLDQGRRLEQQVAGTATVDFYDRHGAGPPYLTAKQDEVVQQALPLLDRGNSRILLIVRATMPSDGARARAAEEARRVADDIARTERP
jgi:hypothetical protein